MEFFIPRNTVRRSIYSSGLLSSFKVDTEAAPSGPDHGLLLSEVIRALSILNCTAYVHRLIIHRASHRRDRLESYLPIV